MESVIHGWTKRKERVWKNTDSNRPIVDFDLILGGEAMTRGMVSRIEVREGRIGEPLAAVSQ